MKKANIAIIVGPCGGGKGTVAKHLSAGLEVEHVSMSALLDGGRPDGNFVDDPTVISTFTEHLGGWTGFLEEKVVGKHRRRQTQQKVRRFGDIVYEGVPRNGEQTEAVCELLRKHGLIDGARFIILDINDKEAMGRQMGRYWKNVGENNLRPDEPKDPEAAHQMFRHRQAIYRVNVPKIEATLNGFGVTPSHIDATVSEQDVAIEVAKALDWDFMRLREWFAFDETVDQAAADVAARKSDEQKPGLTLPLLTSSSAQTAQATA